MMTQEAKAERDRKRIRSHGEAKACFMLHGFSDDDAKKIVKLISQYKITNVTVNY